MNERTNDLIQYLARYALYFVIPGFWFAYIGGAPAWTGGAAGLGAALLVGIPVLMARRTRGPKHDRRLLDDLLVE